MEYKTAFASILLITAAKNCVSCIFDVKPLNKDSGPFLTPWYFWKFGRRAYVCTPPFLNLGCMKARVMLLSIRLSRWGGLVKRFMHALKFTRVPLKLSFWVCCQNCCKHLIFTHSVCSHESRKSWRKSFSLYAHVWHLQVSYMFHNILSNLVSPVINKVVHVNIK